MRFVLRTTSVSATGIALPAAPGTSPAMLVAMSPSLSACDASARQRYLVERASNVESRWRSRASPATWWASSTTTSFVARRWRRARREDDVAALVERLDGACDSHEGLPAAGWRRQQYCPRSSRLDERASLVHRELLKAEQRRREALRERAAVDSDRLNFCKFLVQGSV